MVELPPDLARLGDELALATRRATARRERRRRVAVAAVVGAAAFAAMTPAALGPAHRLPTLAKASSSLPVRCDQPRGARFTLVACSAPMILNRPAAWPSYS
jgi:hypothetical protein